MFITSLSYDFSLINRTTQKRKYLGIQNATPSQLIRCGLYTVEFLHIASLFFNYASNN